MRRGPYARHPGATRSVARYAGAAPRGARCRVGRVRPGSPRTDGVEPGRVGVRARAVEDPPVVDLLPNRLDRTEADAYDRAARPDDKRDDPVLAFPRRLPRSRRADVPVEKEVDECHVRRQGRPQPVDVGRCGDPSGRSYRAELRELPLNTVLLHGQVGHAPLPIGRKFRFAPGQGEGSQPIGHDLQLANGPVHVHPEIGRQRAPHPPLPVLPSEDDPLPC